MRMKVVAPFLLIALPVACTSASTELRGSPRFSPSTAAAPSSGERDEVEIYAALIRRLVTRQDATGGKSSYGRVYVVDGPVGTGKPVPASFGPSPKPFSNAFIDAIRQRLSDLPPLEFVRDGDAVRRGDEGLDGVRHGGVIVSLGPIVRKASEVHVATGLWCGGLCGEWMTYVLTEKDDGWHITGTTGPAIIS